MIIAPTGTLDHDYDDVRSVGEAAAAGISRAMRAGARKPLLVLHLGSLSVNAQRYASALQVAITEALGAAYVPLEVREDVAAPASASVTLEHLFIYAGSEADAQNAATIAAAVEAGRAVARDICG